MEIHQIRYFLTLCRELNFTRAAEVCNVSQPALTKAIKSLEDEFGGELFRRERGNSHLTDLGNLVKPHLEQVLQATEAAQEEATCFKTATKVSLKLGVMCTISSHTIVGFMRAVRERMPTVELSIVELPGKKLVDAMMKGGIDVALIGMPNLPDRFDAIPLYRERYGVAFAKGHRLERLNAIPIDELKNENYLQRTACEFGDHWTAHDEYHNVPVKTIFRSEREDWVQAMLAAGFGLAIMPEYLPRLPGVVLRVIGEPEIARTVSLVTVSGRRFTPATKMVVQLARDYRWELL